MRHLLDVNALIALGYRSHVFHPRVARWAEGKSLLTCSISELGFMRILTQLPEADISLATCRELLSTMKRERRMCLLEDSLSAVELPAWVQKPSQLTDGHFLELARSTGATLATLDKGIPGAFLIPKS